MFTSMIQVFIAPVVFVLRTHVLRPRNILCFTIIYCVNKCLIVAFLSIFSFIYSFYIYFCCLSVKFWIIIMFIYNIILYFLHYSHLFTIYIISFCHRYHHNLKFKFCNFISYFYLIRLSVKQATSPFRCRLCPYQFCSMHPPVIQAEHVFDTSIILDYTSNFASFVIIAIRLTGAALFTVVPFPIVWPSHSHWLLFAPCPLLVSILYIYLLFLFS